MNNVVIKCKNICVDKATNIWYYYIVYIRKGSLRFRNAVFMKSTSCAAAKSLLSRFFMSAAYPPIICALVLFGPVSGNEFFFNIPVILLGSLAFLTCDSIRPFITLFCTFIFQVSVEHTPQLPIGSDYYFTEWRLPVVIVLGVILLVSIILFLVRTGFFHKLGFGKTPMLLPMLLLGVVFALNGLGTETWNSHGMWYGIFNAVVIIVGFILIYHGFSEDESAEELGKYFAYVSSLISVVLIGQLVDLYINGGVLEDGILDRAKFFVGWGVTNTIGVSLAVLIPVIMYGAQKNRCGMLYFAVATMTYLAIPFTLSRNALVVSTLIYFICVAVFCFFGEKREDFRFYTFCCFVMFGIMIVLAWDVINPIVNDFVIKGFGDSGRFQIWRDAFDIFLKNPIFGGGFNALPCPDLVFESAIFMPWMAHNTVFQILCSMGAVGLCAYLIYRVATLVPFFRRPSLLKNMLGLSVAVLLLESLLDNFIFYITPTFYYTVCLAIAYKSLTDEDEKKKEKKLDVKYERRWYF